MRFQGEIFPNASRVSAPAILRPLYLLPCNVMVYELEPGRTAISAMAPLAALGIVGDNLALASVGTEADAQLRRALIALEAHA